MLPLLTIKGVRIFLGHTGFYRRFIKDILKIAKPLCNLLEKDVAFNFDEACLEAFNKLKEKLIFAPIFASLGWPLLFELICGATNFAIYAALGQHINKVFHTIYYASKTVNKSQVNYTTTGKELLVVVYAVDKFRSYLIAARVIVHIYHSLSKYLL